MPTIRLNMTTDFHRSRPLSRSVSSSHNANNVLDRDPPTMSEVCDTPITNNHGGKNISVETSRSIKVTIVRRTIKLNLYQEPINLMGSRLYLSCCDFCFVLHILCITEIITNVRANSRGNVKVTLTDACHKIASE